MRIDYKKRMVKIKPYVDFNFKSNNLNKQQKTLISRYYTLIFGGKKRINGERKNISGLITQLPKVYKPKNKNNLKKAKEFAGLSNTPHLKVAFLPKSNNTKIKFKKGKFTISSNNVDIVFLPFNSHNLANNPVKETKRILRGYENYVYVIKTGNHELRRSSNDINETAEMVEQLQNDYDNEGTNNHYENWLFGVVVYKTKNQRTVSQLFKQREISRKESGLRQRRLKQINKKELDVFHLEKLLTRTKNSVKINKIKAKIKTLNKSITELKRLNKRK